MATPTERRPAGAIAPTARGPSCVALAAAVAAHFAAGGSPPATPPLPLPSHAERHVKRWNRPLPRALPRGVVTPTDGGKRQKVGAQMREAATPMVGAAAESSDPPCAQAPPQNVDGTCGGCQQGRSPPFPAHGDLSVFFFALCGCHDGGVGSDGNGDSDGDDSSLRPPPPGTPPRLVQTHRAAATAVTAVPWRGKQHHPCPLRRRYQARGPGSLAWQWRLPRRSVQWRAGELPEVRRDRRGTLRSRFPHSQAVPG